LELEATIHPGKNFIKQQTLCEKERTLSNHPTYFALIVLFCSPAGIHGSITFRTATKASLPLNEDADNIIIVNGWSILGNFSASWIRLTINVQKWDHKI
jgi:hypothetical protein